MLLIGHRMYWAYKTLSVIARQYGRKSVNDTSCKHVELFIDFIFYPNLSIRSITLFPHIIFSVDANHRVVYE